MSKKVFSVRLPEDTIERLKSLDSDYGINKADVIVYAVNKSTLIDYFESKKKELSRREELLKKSKKENDLG